MKLFMEMFGGFVIGLLLALNGYSVYNPIENRIVKRNVIILVICVIPLHYLIEFAY